MGYISNTDKICQILDTVAARGYLSDPVPTSYGSLAQRVSFSTEETQAVREYIAMCVPVLRGICYKQRNSWDDSTNMSAPLITMLSHMMGNGIGPEYVAANSQRLQDALATHAEQFEALEFSRQMETMMELT